MTVKEFFSFKNNRFFWLNILGMLVLGAALLYGVLVGLDIYTHHGESVKVPELEGLSLDKAKALLEKSNLRYVVADSNYVKEMPEGCVLDIHPEGGESVKEGRVVYLTVNTSNIPLIEVPDVSDNSSYRQAAARLQAAGFKLDSVQYVAGERDWVYGVSYKSHQLRLGEKVPMGAHLTLMVGNGGYGREEDEEEAENDSVAVASSESDESWF